MKNILILLTIALLLLNFTNCTRTSEDKMVLYPVKDDPTVSFRLWFKVGSMDDPAGKEGLSALTAAMITEGATKKHSYEEILEMLYPLAAGINSQVDKEMTIIYGRTHKDNLEKYYNILKEVVLQPDFNQQDFERIRTDMLNYLEKNLRYSNDEELGKEVLSEYIFTNTPYQHIEEGHVSSLDTLSIEDVKEFYDTHFTRANLVIGLGGGYSTDFANRIQKDFEQLPEGSLQQTPPPPPEPITGVHVEIVEKDANATAISFGFPIDVLRGSRDYYALALANSWLGEHRNSSSHLYQVIRETRGLNYGDYSYIEHFPNGGRRQFPPANVARHQQIFQVWIRPVPNETRVFAYRAAVRELQHLIDNGMTEDEFELTRQFLKNYVLHYAPTTMTKLGYAIDDVFYGIDKGHLEKFRAVLDNLTREEVNQAIKKYLKTQNMKVVFVSNDAAGLKNTLVNNKPTPIEYANPKPEKVLQEDKQIEKYPLNVKAENVTIVPVDEVFN